MFLSFLLILSLICKFDSVLTQSLTEAAIKFPSTGPYAYSVLCAYDKLDVKDNRPKECLSFAVSLLSTRPKYPLVFLIHNYTEVSPSYSQVLTTLNVQIHRFGNVDLFPKSYPVTHAYYKTFQTFQCFTLHNYEKVFHLNTDQIVLKNIDDAFDYDVHDEKTITTVDCMFHHQNNSTSMATVNNSTYNTKGGPSNNGNFLVHPNTVAIDLIKKEIAKDVIYRYPDLEIADSIMNLSFLPCHYQIFPDICIRAKSPVLHYYNISRDFYILHYTNTPKVHPLRNMFLRGYMDQFRVKLQWSPEEYDDHKACLSKILTIYFSYERIALSLASPNISKTLEETILSRIYDIKQSVFEGVISLADAKNLHP